MSKLVTIPQISKPPVGTLPNRDDPLMKGLVGWWLMNEGAGLIAQDISGYINHGTITNGAKWVGGKNGSALLFDGTNDYISLPSSITNLPSGGGPISISVRLKFTTGITTQGIVTIAHAAQQGFAIMGGSTAGHVGMAYAASGVPAWLYNTKALNDGVWHHVVATAESTNYTTWKLYFDGVLTSRTVGSAYIGSSGIGRGYYGYFPGTLDDVRIYNRVITPQEIKKLYTQPFSMFDRKLFIPEIVPSGTRRIFVAS